MMKQEFEKIAGRTVTAEQFDMINGLYMESDLDKYEFVKSLKGMLKTIPEKHESIKKVMAVRDNSGYYRTPNGCYLHLVDVEVMDVNIKTGKVEVKVVPNSYRLGYSADLYETDEKVEVVA